jgi:hypothetical protein
VKQYFATEFDDASNSADVLLKLTTYSRCVVLNRNMPADLLIDDRYILDETSFVELVVWRLERPLRGSQHPLKYRLAYVEDGICVIRYDNEAGKGDHRHASGKERPYAFSDLDTLLTDFWAEVDTWRRK